MRQFISVVTWIRGFHKDGASYCGLFCYENSLHGRWVWTFRRYTVSTFRDVVLSYGSVFDDGGNMFLQHVDNNLPDDTTSQTTENVNSVIYFNTSEHQSHTTCVRNPVIVLIQNTEKRAFQLCHR